MTQAETADLFGLNVSVISRHISNVIEDGELDELTSLQKMQTSTGRSTALYSLDMVISVRYPVSAAQAPLFRRWATEKNCRDSAFFGCSVVPRSLNERRRALSPKHRLCRAVNANLRQRLGHSTSGVGI